MAAGRRAGTGQRRWDADWAEKTTGGEMSAGRESWEDDPDLDVAGVVVVVVVVVAVGRECSLAPTFARSSNEEIRAFAIPCGIRSRDFFLEWLGLTVCGGWLSSR